MTDDVKNKARDFVNHLFNNPNIKEEPLLIAEGLLLNFIVQNMEQLKLTFKTPQFFPDLEWNEVLQLLLSDLLQRISEQVLPVLDTFINELDYSVLNKVSDGMQTPEDFQREKLQLFLKTIFKNKDVRFNLNAVVNMFKNNIIEKYINEIFNQRGFLFNEIVRVQKTNLDSDEYIVFMKVLLLVRSSAYLKIPAPTTGVSKNININDALKMRAKFPKYLNDAVINGREQLPFLTEKTIRLALKSNLRNTMTDIDEASSRLIFILCSRFHNYKPMAKVDRGAESPDKSWFSIARKNSEHYGFDKRMLEELYRISGDNNW